MSVCPGAPSRGCSAIEDGRYICASDADGDLSPEEDEQQPESVDVVHDVLSPTKKENK